MNIANTRDNQEDIIINYPLLRDEIFAYIKANNINQSQLTKKADISFDSMNCMIKGKFKNSSVILIYKISKTLNRKIEHFLIDKNL